MKNKETSFSPRAQLLRHFVKQFDRLGIRAINVPPVLDAETGQYVPQKTPSFKKLTTELPTVKEVLNEITGEIRGVPENLSVLCGAVSGNLAVVSLDSAEALAAWPVVMQHYGLNTPLVCGRPGKPGAHYYYRCEMEVPNLRFYDIPASGDQTVRHFELLGKGPYAMAPPSIHPDCADDVSFQSLINSLNPDSIPTVMLADLTTAVKLTAAASLIAHHWHEFEGKHCDIILAVSETCAHNGWDEKKTQMLVDAICAAVADNPKRYRETVTSTFNNHARGEQAAGCQAMIKLVGEKLYLKLEELMEQGRSLEAPIDEAPMQAFTSVTVAPATDWQPVNTASWRTSPPEPMKWLFDNMIPEGVVAGLSAPGGTGKSYFALQLGVSLALGRAMFSSFIPAGKRRVMLFLGEDPEAVTYTRMEHIRTYLKLANHEDELIDTNLQLYTIPGEPLLRSSKDGPKFTEAYERMRQAIEAFKPSLVIIDPKSRWSGFSENNNDLNTRFVSALEDLVKPHHASILITHHVNKAKRTNGTAASVRGASAFVDAARVFFGMARRGNLVELQMSKGNYSACPPKPIILRHNAEHGGIFEEMAAADGNAETVSYSILGDNASILARKLAEALSTRPEGITLSSLKHPRLKHDKSIAKELGEIDRKWKLLLHEIIEAGVAEGLLRQDECFTGGRPGQRIYAAKDYEEMLSQNWGNKRDGDLGGNRKNGPQKGKTTEKGTKGKEPERKIISGDVFRRMMGYD